MQIVKIIILDDTKMIVVSRNHVYVVRILLLTS